MSDREKISVSVSETNRMGKEIYNFYIVKFRMNIGDNGEPFSSTTLVSELCREIDEYLENLVTEGQITLV